MDRLSSSDDLGAQAECKEGPYKRTEPGSLRLPDSGLSSELGFG